MLDQPLLKVVFFRTSAGREPVREWLKSLRADDKKAIGEDIKTLQYTWPVGMPLVRKLAPDLWEIRARTSTGICRVFFTIQGQFLILLHGFIKKSSKTPLADIALARQRLAQLRGEA
jgi:phage-related protein